MPSRKQCLARLIESSPDAIISTDRDGNVVLFSESAEALLGYRAKEVAGRSMSVLYGLTVCSASASRAFF
jgi:PAS domain S-box-containing protein